MGRLLVPKGPRLFPYGAIRPKVMGPKSVLSVDVGRVVLGAPLKILRETPATALVDVYKGFGYVTCGCAMCVAVYNA